jgi:DNA-binding PadR family transcriptional regulator
MAPKLISSRQTRAVLEALLRAASDWRYGYDLSKETGLKSGTLYPILMRLEAQGWLEARWEDAQGSGRPPRHLYRLTTKGLEGVPGSVPSSGQVVAADILLPAAEGGPP